MSDAAPPGGIPPEEGVGLSAGVRVGLYLLLILFVVFLGGAVLGSLFLPRDLAGEDLEIGQIFFLQVLLAPSILVATVIYVRRVDGRGVDSIGVRWPGGDPAETGRLVPWLAAAPVTLLGAWWLLASIFADLDVTGWEAELVAGPEWWPGAFGGLLRVTLFAAALLVWSTVEEWIFHGYVYSTFRERFAWTHAAGLTSLLFALFHFDNPGLTAPGLMNTFLLGLLLALLREASGSLWPGAFCHALWNILVAQVASLELSGLTLPGLLDVTASGPEAVTGGDYGPEGSWLLTPVLLAALVGLARLISRRDQLASE